MKFTQAHVPSAEAQVLSSKFMPKMPMGARAMVRRSVVLLLEQFTQHEALFTIITSRIARWVRSRCRETLETCVRPADLAPREEEGNE